MTIVMAFLYLSAYIRNKDGEKMKSLILIIAFFCVGCNATAKDSTPTMTETPINACGVIKHNKNVKVDQKYFLRSIKKFTWTSVDGGKFQAIESKKDAGN
tara:strand:+ start:297 stop:596 length:300 start_codon:yes stop_codon:yes gene_type:complete